MSSAEEGQVQGSKKVENGDNMGRSASEFIKENWNIGLRIIELIFAIFCIGLVVDPVTYGGFRMSTHHIAMIYSAYSSFIIINTVLLIGEWLGDRVGWRTSVIISLVGTVVFTAAGGVIIYDWTRHMYNHLIHPSKQYLDMFISSGVFAIFNAFIYLLDAIFTYREEP